MKVLKKNQIQEGHPAYKYWLGRTGKKPNSGSFKKEQIPWNKNRKGLQVAWNKGTCGICKKNSGSFTPERVRGKANGNWQGGKSYEIYPLGWNRTFKEQIRRRDNYKCQICDIPEVECRRRLSVHHKDLNKKNLNEDNLISLCDKCHKELHWQIQKS